MQGLFNSFAEKKEHKYKNSVVETKLYPLFDLQGLFNIFAEIKRTKIYKQFCSSKTVFIVWFVVSSFYSIARKLKIDYTNSVVQTKLYSLFELKDDPLNSVAEIKRTKLYKQCCINKSAFMVWFVGSFNSFAYIKIT